MIKVQKRSKEINKINKVRIEKGSVQTVAIKLEAHNSLDYHYMLKH